MTIYKNMINNRVFIILIIYHFFINNHNIYIYISIHNTYCVIIYKKMINNQNNEHIISTDINYYTCNY